jgi:hypothetical protein
MGSDECCSVVLLANLKRGSMSNSMLVQSAEIRRTKREADAVALKNKQMQYLIESYKGPISPIAPDPDADIPITNTGEEPVTIIHNIADSIVIPPGETRILKKDDTRTRAKTLR